MEMSLETMTTDAVSDAVTYGAGPLELTERAVAHWAKRARMNKQKTQLRELRLDEVYGEKTVPELNLSYSHTETAGKSKTSKWSTVWAVRAGTWILNITTWTGLSEDRRLRALQDRDHCRSLTIQSTVAKRRWRIDLTKLTWPETM